MAAEQQRREECPEEEQPFRANAFQMIETMVELDTPPSDRTTLLVDEIMHSIFFLGNINEPRFSPKKIINDSSKFDEWKGRYPRPFDLYSTQLPRRSPFSCVLDMVVHLTGQENEDEIIQKLQEIIDPLSQQGNKKPLTSSTVCVSQKTEDSVRYYGVSMSTSSRNAGRVMVAASCLSSWDSYVAGAVMTYYPEQVKKAYFDATIKLPEGVRCQTFNIRQGTPKDPCRSCGNLFGLNTSDSKAWDYGNCAAAESVSNLLKNEAEVREQARPTSETCTEENRQRAEGSMLAELKNVLRMLRFTWKPPYEFYTPQIERGND